MPEIVITLYCPVCKREEVVKIPLKDKVVDFSEDKMCCGKWMEKKNKEVKEV
jgi:hypothetical protein